MKKVLAAAAILGLGFSVTVTPAQAAPDTCYEEKRQTDCTEAMNYATSGPTWRAYIRVYKEANQTGESVVLYPGDHTRHYAGRSDWGSVRVPAGTKAVRVTRVNNNTQERVEFKWYPFGTGGGNGKMNLRSPGSYIYYFKLWRPEG